MAEAFIPITGRRLSAPEGPIFHVQRTGEAEHELGAFRRWAGYKDLGVEAATGGLALLQHVLSFGETASGGRTGVHCHLAHVHIVIPTSGRGVFSYDGVDTEAVSGGVIVQHGGTIHDQFDYSYAARTEAENRQTPQAVEPADAGAQPRSFGFLELFVPPAMANVEIVPPDEVTETDHRSAWEHPYHTPGSRFHHQPASAPEAAFHPLAMRPDLEVRDAGTWGPTGELVATWIIRPAEATASMRRPLSLEIPGETGGIEIHYMVSGQATFRRRDGGDLVLHAGDSLTCSQGLVGDPVDMSPDMRLLRFFIAAKAQHLRERTPAEIQALEDLGPRIITHRELRPPGDDRPINFMQDGVAEPVEAPIAVSS